MWLCCCWNWGQRCFNVHDCNQDEYTTITRVIQTWDINRMRQKTGWTKKYRGCTKTSIHLDEVILLTSLRYFHMLDLRKVSWCFCSFTKCSQQSEKRTVVPLSLKESILIQSSVSLWGHEGTSVTLGWIRGPVSEKVPERPETFKTHTTQGEISNSAKFTAFVSPIPTEMWSFTTTPSP